MKIILLSIAIATSVSLFAQTKSTAKNTVASKTTTDKKAIAVLVGTWEGTMSGKKLTVVIEKVIGTEVIGYNILGTNKRPLKGKLKVAAWDQPCSKAYDVVLNEPGDDKWDGIFTIKFVGYENTDDNTNECLGNLKGAEATGSWRANNGKSKKEFELVFKK